MNAVRGGREVTRRSVLIAVTGGSPLLRSALCIALTASEAEFEGRDAADPAALERLRKEGVRPAAVLWLADDHGEDGQHEISSLAAAMEEVPVVVVAPGASIAGVTRTLEAGAKGLVPHSESMRELTAALGFVIDGGIYIPAGALIAAPEPARATRKSRGPGAGTGSAVERLETLTDRQREIVEHVAAGMSNREIADALGIREGTVKVHVARVLEKLGVGNRLEAALAVAESRSRRDEDRVPSTINPARAARRR